MTCEVDKPPENNLKKEMHDDVVELLSNGKPQMFEKCLEPCLTTHIR